MPSTPTVSTWPHSRSVRPPPVPGARTITLGRPGVASRRSASSPASRAPAATAGVIAALGAAVGLAGDACHVASGTTHYDWHALPTIWRSVLWFPLLLGGAVLLAAWLGRRAALPWVRPRDRADVAAGAGLVLALYALTAALRHQPTTVSVVLTGSLAIAIWAWWDPSPGTLAIAIAAAIAGPLVEIAIVAAGAASYADDV